MLLHEQKKYIYNQKIKNNNFDSMQCGGPTTGHLMYTQSFVTPKIYIYIYI